MACAWSKDRSHTRVWATTTGSAATWAATATWFSTVANRNGHDAGDLLQDGFGAPCRRVEERRALACEDLDQQPLVGEPDLNVAVHEVGQGRIPPRPDISASSIDRSVISSRSAR